MCQELISLMLDKYKAETDYEKKNALKEILQQLVLVGLSRLGFFNTAAFYGGTALRMFYGLDRFSEDLDFSLKSTNPAFRLEKFLPLLEKEINSFGMNVSVEAKDKKDKTPIKTAFVRGNTRENFMKFYSDVGHVAKTDNIKIRLEVDITPPPFAEFEYKDLWTPLSNECRILLYDEPSLFAGKIHAVLDRKWHNRVKGRDLYDYVFYLKHRKTRVNLKHLLARLQASGFISTMAGHDIEGVRRMLCDRFDNIDFSQAQEDVYTFIKDNYCLTQWNGAFFKSLTRELNAD